MAKIEEANQTIFEIISTSSIYLTGYGKVIGPMFAGYTEEDSGLDIGDSAITETFGLGGFAMAAAPAIVALVGGTVADATNYSLSMESITTGLNPNVTIPSLNFMDFRLELMSLK